MDIYLGQMLLDQWQARQQEQQQEQQMPSGMVLVEQWYERQRQRQVAQQQEGPLEERLRSRSRSPEPRQ